MDHSIPPLIPSYLTLSYCFLPFHFEQEVLVTIRAKFDKAKEEVDSDLHLFAADLLNILEKNTENQPEWQETLEDLLVLAQRCAMTTPGEFWLQCESIVQDLDDKRQELPMGILKKLHTRMLFILTRCTRLLQFHKESGLAENELVFQLRQSLHSADKNISQKPSKLSTIKYYSQEQHRMHDLSWKKDQPNRYADPIPTPIETGKDVELDLESPTGRNRMASWKKLPSPGGKISKEAVTPVKDKKVISPEVPTAKDSHTTTSKHQHSPSWGWGDHQSNYADDSPIICRICEELVPTLQLEDHSRICAIADRCDQKGLRVDERLIRVSETLEKLMESYTQKDLTAGGSPDGAKVSNSSVTEEYDVLSPKLSDWSRRGSEDMLDCFPDGDNPGITDDMKGVASSSMPYKTRFGPKSDQGMTTSSAGSITPRSPLLTPRTSQIDLLLAGKGSYSEHADLPQV